MHAHIILIISLFLYITPIQSASREQIKTVNGRVLTEDIEQGRRKVLPSASILILQMPDSTIVKGGTSNKSGLFQLNYPVQQNTIYLLKVSFVGMQSYYHTLSNTITTENLGDILLKDSNTLLEGISVTAKLSEIQMKGDTTIVNTAAYQIPINSYLGALVKRIPGMEYDEKNNKLTYNGKIIEEIVLNGKPFFNGNLQMALANLPLDLIQNIRIYNKTTELEKFTGFNNGNKHYILDLKSKAEFNYSLLSPLKFVFCSLLVERIMRVKLFPFWPK